MGQPDHIDKSRWTFNPTISFDGVAIIVACIGCSIWFGALKETVRQQGEAIKHHDEMIESLIKSQQSQNDLIALQSANVSVLQAIVNERTKKP